MHTNIFCRALPRGEKRNHFLSLATPDAIKAAKLQDSAMFADAHYNMRYCTLQVYDLSALWTWAVCDMEEPPILCYTDV